MRIECIECGKVQEVELTRGRPRFFCPEKCRGKAYYKCQANPDLVKEYEAKRQVIKRQYREAKRTSRSLSGLRRRAMSVLRSHGWSVGDIAILFEVSDTRVRAILTKRGGS